MERLIWPAAERNKGPILAMLQDYLGDVHRVLEVASGTGQQVAHFAAALPHVHWQPSDPDLACRESILATVVQFELANVAAPIDLDVCADWPALTADLILVCNLLHIAPQEVLEGLCRGAAKTLTPGQRLLIYGPFKQDGRFRSTGDAAFDQSLRERDARWGIRDVESVREMAAVHGLQWQCAQSMPANNLTLVFERVSA